MEEYFEILFIFQSFSSNSIIVKWQNVYKFENYLDRKFIIGGMSLMDFHKKFIVRLNLHKTKVY